MNKSPKIAPPKLGPLPPTSASAAPTGSTFGSRRSFDLPGVTTGRIINPNLLRRNVTDRGQRTTFGGSA
jgi:hypothetical protein